MDHLFDRVRAADGLASRIDSELPVIVVSGRDGEADVVRASLGGPTIIHADRAEPRLQHDPVAEWAQRLFVEPAAACDVVDEQPDVVDHAVGG